MTRTPPPLPSRRALSRETAAVLCVTILTLGAVLIFAEGDVRTALLAILTTLSTLAASVLPPLLSKGDAQ